MGKKINHHREAAKHMKLAAKHSGNAKNYFGMDYFPAEKVRKHERKEKKLIKKLADMHKDY
jgi:hypothetical protein